jgi:hypothetical protein
MAYPWLAVAAVTAAVCITLFGVSFCPTAALCCHLRVIMLGIPYAAVMLHSRSSGLEYQSQECDVALQVAAFCVDSSQEQQNAKAVNMLSPLLTAASTAEMGPLSGHVGAASASVS